MTTQTHVATRSSATPRRPVFAPRTDIYETPEAIFLVAEMPGVDENSTDVLIEKGVLTIRGRATHPTFEGVRVVAAEYEVGDFERSFTLTDIVDGSQIDASIKNGVLTLRLPKAPHALKQRIPVKSA